MKNRIILGVLTVILLGLNLLFLNFANNKNSLFITLGYLILIFICYRLLLFLLQKILVKFKILQYKPDNLRYYPKDEWEIREQSNVKYKMQVDRVISAVIYNIIFYVLVVLAVKFNNDEGIISSLIVALLLSAPPLVFMPRVTEWEGIGKLGGTVDHTYEAPKTHKIRATTWDFGGYKETTYRDENGNKVGEAKSFDWGPVKDTTITDKDGNKTKIEHWKF